VTATERREVEPAAAPGVTFVIPVHNGARWLDQVLTAVWAQDYAGRTEAIAVEDGSTDGSRGILARHAANGRLTIVDGPRRGATAALNAGIAAAAQPLIAQIDQDVIIERDWLARLAAELETDPAVAAAQGHYVEAPGAGLWSRVMALDLRARYRALRSTRPDHVCTGNSVYRATALRAAGLFDEDMGYGYDNDMSYRLIGAGYRLAHVAAARSAHHWREGLVAYARQQYGFGYGRLDLIAKHRHRSAGDDVSPFSMMLHGPAMALAIALSLVAAALAAVGLPAALPAWAAGLLLSLIVLERFAAGVAATVRFRNPAGLWFAPAHVVRDGAWVAAMAVWSLRRLLGRRARPAHSMRPRAPDRGIQNRPPA
jgi:glycosyltransferase involved in cell wall biosynthesis